jgi:protein-tyrosine-phosphatase
MKRVLFVCVGNSGRSQMAEALFNHSCGGDSLAISAGTRPATSVSRIAIAAMAELDPAGRQDHNNGPRRSGELSGGLSCF